MNCSVIVSKHLLLHIKHKKRCSGSLALVQYTLTHWQLTLIRDALPKNYMWHIHMYVCIYRSHSEVGIASVSSSPQSSYLLLSIPPPPPSSSSRCLPLFLFFSKAEEKRIDNCHGNAHVGYLAGADYMPFGIILVQFGVLLFNRMTEYVSYSEAHGKFV